MEEMKQGSEKKIRSQHNIALFVVVVILWLVFDQITKNYFNALYTPGEVITDPILGLFQFFLVHNTGAAWGLFGDSTFMLGVTSTIVCMLLLVYFIFSAKRMNVLEVFGLALVFAGGLGNAIDRFSLNYVVDFINFTFMKFPVFNIADIGVTCGFVLFFIGLIYSWRKESATEKAKIEASQDEGELQKQTDASPLPPKPKDI